MSACRDVVSHYRFAGLHWPDSRQLAQHTPVSNPIGLGRSVAAVMHDMQGSEHLMIPLQYMLLPLAAHFAHFPAVATFVINIVALIPLALVLGEITEVGDAAAHQGLERTFR